MAAPAQASQQLTQPADPPAAVVPSDSPSGYSRPTGADALHAIFSDSVGPYAVFMGLATAGIHQATDNPHEWGEGAAGFSKRFASNMGITVSANAVRYGLGTAMNVDTLYYRCSCTGVIARLRHAVLSTVIARDRDDGFSTFSYPGVVAPYAASFTAVYGWYPRRYGAEDAFRMGNYNLLGTVGSNITFEFIPRKAHEFLYQHHLSSSRMSEVTRRRP